MNFLLKISRNGSSMVRTGLGQPASLFHATTSLTEAAPTKTSTSVQPASGSTQLYTEVMADAYEKDVKVQTARWHKMHEIYYGPDRDHTNFPIVKMNEIHPKVRMGFLPDSWFQAFYNKTGVTGPYVFLLGGFITLTQKEIWVMDHDFFEIAPFVGMVYLLTYKLGPKLSEFCSKKVEHYNNLLYHKPLRVYSEKAETLISDADEEHKRVAALPMVYQAKRDIVDLQLEAAYRQRLVDLSKMVRRRMDYQVEKLNVERRFQQQHMATWILNSVVKGITPQQEKDSIQKCIADLKALAQKSKLATA